MKEVYEPESQTCTAISLSRDDYRDSEGTTSFLDYVSASEFATRLSCCLAYEIYAENSLACGMDVQEFSEYEWDSDAMTCTEMEYTRTDLVDPDTGSRLIRQGEPTLVNKNTLGGSEGALQCCREIN